MPYSKEKMNEYMLAKYYKRRAEAIEYLGGRCVDCFSTGLLEFDHTRDKSFSIANRLNSAPWQVILDELDKCVLRCVGCHAHMTAYRKLENVDVLGSVW